MRIATSPSKEMVDESCRNGTPNSAQNTGPTERLEVQGRDGKMTSTNSSLVEEETENLSESSSHGSTQQKTAEDGLYSKKIHIDFGRTTGK